MKELTQQDPFLFTVSLIHVEKDTVGRTGSVKDKYHSSFYMHNLNSNAIARKIYQSFNIKKIMSQKQIDTIIDYKFQVGDATRLQMVIHKLTYNIQCYLKHTRIFESRG